MADWKEKNGLKWRALDQFRIEIDHDFSTPLAPVASQQLLDLYRESGLLVARNQSISMPQQISLMELFGKVQRRLDGIGYITTEDHGVVARTELPFHADYAFGSHPLDALSLHAINVIDGASSTRFASADHAWEALPANLQNILESHSANMISPNYTSVAVRSCEVRDPDAALRNVRPAILKNPNSGRTCIGVGEMHTASLSSMKWEDSRDTLKEIFDYLYAAENVVDHVWLKGDLVIWDNLTYQHARGPLTGVGSRVLQRVVVGEKSMWEMFPDVYPDLKAFYAAAG